MDAKLKNRAITLFRQIEAPKSNRAQMLRKTYGDRITKAATAEVEQLEEEIAALNATIELLEGLD